MSASYRPPELFPSSNRYLDLPNPSEDVAMSDADSDMYTDCPESVPNEVHQPQSFQEVSSMPLPEIPKPSFSVPGMYLVLDLISEEGSGGMVDKVIIAQDTLPQLINDISPGSYSSLTKLDFDALDQLPICPLGVYGSKTSIVSFLLELSVIDNDMASLLLDEQAHEQLKSGLYVVLPTGGSLQTLLIYWPEKMTWNVNPPTNARRNRITFIRYLTKLADQLVCFVSSADSSSIIWTRNIPASIELDESDSDDEEQSDDRLFSFEVAKTHEQEQNVTHHPGFEVLCHSLDSLHATPPSAPRIRPPCMIPGETSQAVILAQYRSASPNSRSIKKQQFTRFKLREMLDKGHIQISSQVEEAGLNFMLECGLRERCSALVSEYKQRNACIDKTTNEQKVQELTSTQDEMKAQAVLNNRIILMRLLHRVLDTYPTLHTELLEKFPSINEMQNQDAYMALVDTVPEFEKEFTKVFPSEKFHPLPKSFATLKNKLILADEANQKKTHFDSPETRVELLISCLRDGAPKIGEGSTPRPGISFSGAVSGAVRMVPGASTVLGMISPSDENKDIINAAHRRFLVTSDSQFCGDLDELAASEPLFQIAVLELKEHAIHCLAGIISKAHTQLLEKLQQVQHRACKNKLDKKYASRLTQECADSRSRLYDAIASATIQPSNAVLIVDELVPQSSLHGYTSYCTLSGRTEQLSHPSVEFTIVPLVVSATDIHQMSLDPSCIPSPQEAREGLMTKFNLPVDNQILFIQLVGNDKCLVVIENNLTLNVYLDSMIGLPGAIKNRRARKTLHRDKLGGDVCMAFDDARRLFAICSVRNLSLVLYSFTEDYSGLNSWGAAIDLTKYYSDATQIVNMCFVSGNDEILIISNENHARVFSLISRQFRPGSVFFPEVPSTVHSSPDGVCLFVAFKAIDNVLYAYHWDTFGSSNEGIYIDLANLPVDSRVLTSIGSRHNPYFIGLDHASHRCVSVRLSITKKATNFQFLSKDRHQPTTHDVSIRNPFIDCLSEVWRRFPVIPTVTRQTTLHSNKQERRITFVAQSHHADFLPYFQDAVRCFEQQTRKPTGDILSRTIIEAKDTNHFLAEIQLVPVTEFRSGEWIVDMLCLIPIHIAVTRENRFIPLQDGVVSRELEQSLLGADVGRVVDSISLGWYESIFRSYHALKPVKVVSSMGEQSVGKSFALNHLADTSFAGSAMRTTEGVWMSVTPTKNTLLVALDFEGVHSIERSAQEDTLLVLFNTAISNLVLFRNNFALSRDITGLFQSFQSSTNVLDPASNPSLFQSRLAIIIKDVVENDTNEIVREFQLKFHKIVEAEQDANFISQLHAGQLDIIPWPVIESKQFYTLFSKIKRRLDKQPTTHTSAGEFLQVMKTLMAKLKTNDWGAMSHTMATHRAQGIFSILPNALTLGQTEMAPDIDPLKSLDTDLPINGEDTDSIFMLGDSTVNNEQRDTHLHALQGNWDQYFERHCTDDIEWINGLSNHILRLVDLRICHVKLWIDTNLSRFLDGQRLAIVEEVYRKFESLSTELKMNVELCKLRCAECSLHCLRARSHDSTLSHDCNTSHKCSNSCEFMEDHPNVVDVKCGYPAGHTGKHICFVDTHLCGEPCQLRGKKGCLVGCVKMVSHIDSEDHICSSRLHACGEPCLLVGVPISPTRSHTCPGTCTIALDQPHEEHLCEVTSCPISCQLCQRLCASRDHLHSFQPNVIHLCGQTHPCSASCEANGICEIETAPQSIEATFTGRNETFQYTKYSQVAKRAKCVMTIDPGELTHAGPHSHSTDTDAFHFCEAQCTNCGYYCTLPLGHPQQEHETRHGSMSKTRWAVEGPDTNVIEVDGRKFSAQDDGAPMLCSLVCSSLSRHTHVDFCRSDDPQTCGDHTDIQHIKEKMLPDPNSPKDFTTHSLHWRRCGFKDPYSRDEQTNFGKCDSKCSGTEHTTTASTAAQPSFCTLPMFHPPATSRQVTGFGYASNDGHLFSCKNPTVMKQAFHVIFVIDRSGSMGYSDRRPLPGTPATNRIISTANNRLGAVYSSLYAFWTSRAAALNAPSSQGQAGRRDAYSVILFDHNLHHATTNDFTSSPDELLDVVLRFRDGGGTNYTTALTGAAQVVENHWSTERSPVVIFLSDGECSVDDSVVAELCRTSVTLGKPLSFHSVSFGPRNVVLRRMAQVARDIQNNIRPDPLLPAEARIESSYSEALDSVRLAETFLGFADSLRNARGSLMG